MTEYEWRQWRFDHGVGPAPRIPQTPGGAPADLLSAGGSHLLTPGRYELTPAAAEGDPRRPARFPAGDDIA
jgi:hypothetical protein